jgi:hypothetical protein
MQRTNVPAGIIVMEAGHPFIDRSKMQPVKQLSPISSQLKPSMVRRDLQRAKAHKPRRTSLTLSTPCRVMTPEPENAQSPTALTAEPLSKRRLVRPLQPWNAMSLISVTPSATVTWVTSASSYNSPPGHCTALPVYTTAFDISERAGRRVAEGVDAVEGGESRGAQRWVGSAR